MLVDGQAQDKGPIPPLVSPPDRAVNSRVPFL